MQKQEGIDIILRTLGVAQATQALGGLNKAVGSVSLAMKALPALAIVSAITKVFTASAEAEQAQIKLAQAITAVGGNAKAVAAPLNEFLGRMQEASGVADEELSGSLEIALASGLSLANGMKILERSLDIAARKGIDHRSVMEAMVKTYEGNTGALGRYGVKLTEGVSGQEALDQALERTTGYVGAAAASMEGGAGKTKAFGVAIGELMEAVGNIVNSPPIQKLIGFVTDLVTWFTKAINVGVELSKVFFSDQTDKWAALANVIAKAGAETKTTAEIIEAAGAAGPKGRKPFKEEADEAARLAQMSKKATEELQNFFQIRDGLKVGEDPNVAYDKQAKIDQEKFINDEMNQVTAQFFQEQENKHELFIDNWKQKDAERAAAFDKTVAVMTRISDTFVGALVDGFSGASVDIKGIFKGLLAELAKMLLSSLFLKVLKIVVGGPIGFVGTPAATVAGSPLASQSLAFGGAPSNIYNINVSSMGVLDQAQVIMDSIDQASRTGRLSLYSRTDRVRTGSKDGSITLNLNYPARLAS